MKLLNVLTAQKHSDRRAELFRNLKRREAKIGGEVFGPIPAGRRREFFCLDRYTWVWHEEWTDSKGQIQSKTTRYDLRPTDVIKSQDGHYQPVDYDEMRRLYDAIGLYGERVDNELYQPAIAAAQ